MNEKRELHQKDRIGVRPLRGAFALILRAFRRSSQESSPDNADTKRAALVALALLIVSAVFSQQPDRSVLILNSYHPTFYWTSQQVRGITGALQNGVEGSGIHIEYMDSFRWFDEDELFPLLADLYRHKYADIEFDLIIATDDVAYNFLRIYDEEIFNDAPVAFTGINSYDPAQLKGEDNFTGVVESRDVKGTIDVILQVQPELQRLVIVLDQTSYGTGWRGSMEEAIKQSRYAEITIDIWDTFTARELIDRVGRLQGEVAVLLMPMLRDTAGATFYPLTLLSQLSELSSVPLYGIHEQLLGEGIVGGKLKSGYYMGQQVAEIARRILDGENPADIPVQLEREQYAMFDYDQLERFNIDTSLLPENSIVINRPFSFYRQYKWRVWSAVFVMIVFLLLSLLLAYQNIRRKHTEDLLRRAHGNLEATLNALPDMLFELDSGGRIYDYRVPGEEGALRRYRGKCIDDVFPLRAARVIRESLEIAARQGRHTGAQYQLAAQDEVRWYELSVAKTDSDLTAGTRFIMLAREITDRRRREDELRRINRQLERFTYAVSHDLKSPLVTIENFMGFLGQDLRGGDRGAVEGDMQHIVNAVERMDILLRELLELSRIGRTEKPSEEVSLQELARQAIDGVREQIVARNVDVRVAEAPILLYGDRARLLTVFNRLLDNAIRYLGDQAHPRIEIGIDERDGKSYFFVRDNGIGIDPAYHERVFNLFEQLSVRNHRAGMGLPLVRRIVELYGGTIWVESAGQGKGAAFYFSLPTAEVHQTVTEMGKVTG